MENFDIRDKTETGQERWMNNKTKRDIEERKREPYDPNKQHLKIELDAKCVTKRQLLGQRKMKETLNLAEKYSSVQPTIGRTDLPTFYKARNQRNDNTIDSDLPKDNKPPAETQRVEIQRPSTTMDWWKQRSGYNNQPSIVS